jgi:hypothetical protein
MSGHVGERAGVERVHERFRVFLARQVVEKSAGYQDLPLDVRRLVGEVDEGRVGIERLTFDEGVVTPPASRAWLSAAPGLERRRTRRHS